MNGDYCSAEHDNAIYGCYGAPNHAGKHWCYASKVKDTTDAFDRGYDRIWEWETSSTPEALTNEELAVLAVLVLPLDKLYPELGPKILRMKEALK